jgi:heme A synthase
MTVAAWRVCRDDLRVIVSSIVALALVIVAALLGGITVLTELAWWVVLLHLGIAEAVVACMAVALVFGWNAGGEVSGDKADWYDVLVVCAVVGTFALILSGSYMVGRGYGSTCATWPLCRGSVLPEGGASLVHMAHRYAAALVGVLIVGTAVAAWSRRARSPRLFWAALLAACLFVAQAMVGAATVWTGFAPSLKAVHLVMATLLWVSLATQAALIFRPRRYERRDVAESLRWLPGLERMAP